MKNPRVIPNQNNRNKPKKSPYRKFGRQTLRMNESKLAKAFYMLLITFMVAGILLVVRHYFHHLLIRH